MIKVAVVDVQTIVRWALSTSFIALGEFEDVPEPDGADVVIVGVDGGLPFLQPYRGRPCIAYGVSNTAGFEAQAIITGATAYVSTTCPVELLTSTIVAVAAGNYQPAAEVAAMVSAGGPAGGLTVREREVMELLVGGLSCAEIGHKLGISVKTCDTHRGHIMKKLGMRNNADLTRFAISYGLATVDWRAA